MTTGTPAGTTIERPGRRRWPIILAAVLIIALIGGVVAYEVLLSPGVTIQGAGATFPAPLIQNWTTTYHTLYSNTTINYNSIGSGAGIQLITNGTVDFGASDAPLSDAQLSPGLTLLPETLGGVAITYNLPTIRTDTHLNFTGDVIVQIYNGSITSWSDTRIQSLNLGVTLPGTTISPVHRSDGSGTTYAFTDYLANVSSWWRSGGGGNIGRSTTVSWPTVANSLAGKGNSGVAGQVKNTPGAIGYVDLIYATQNNLGVGAVKNKASNFVVPSLDTILFAATVSNNPNPADLRQHIVNAGGALSYPISTYTYIIVWKDLSKNPINHSKATAYALVKFLWWAVHDGQAKAPGLLYAQLPANIVSADETLLRSLNYSGQQLIS